MRLSRLLLMSATKVNPYIITATALRDEFTTTESAPMATPRTCEPGPGTLVKTDVSDNSTIAGKRLTIAGGGANNPNWPSGATVARGAGRLTYTRANVLYTGGFITGISSTSNGASYTDRFYIRAGFAIAAANGAFPSINIADTTIRKGAPYYYIFADTALGRLYFLVGPDFPIPTCVYYNRADTTANVYPVHSNYTNAPSRVDEIASMTIAVYPEALTTGSVSGVGVNTYEAGNANHLTIGTVTRTSADTVGIIVKYVDAQNYIRVVHNGTHVLIIQKLANSDTTLATTAIAYAAGKDILVMCSGAVVRAWYNNTAAGTGTIHANLLASTVCGVYSDHADNAVANMEVYARGNSSEYDYFSNYLTRKAQNGRLLIFDGDSITAGSGDSTSYPYKVAYAYTPIADSVNFGLAGQKISQMVTNSGAKMDGLTTYYADTVLVCFAGTNDLAASDSAANVEANIQAYHLARKAAGFKTIAVTILPRAAITGALEIARVAVNAWIMANYATFANGVVDAATQPELDDCTDTNYFNADGTHLIEAGNTALAGYVKTAIDAIA